MPVLGSQLNANEENPAFEPRPMSSASIGRTSDEIKQEILHHQQSSSSNLERKLQQHSPIHRDDEGGSRGSGIEEMI